MERFAKGTPVKMFFNRSFSYDLKVNDVSFENVLYVVKGKLKPAVMFDGFISGDTKEKGVSIVTLDNPLFCVYNNDPKRHGPCIKDRKKFAKGYDDGDLSQQAFGFAPVCPY